MRGSNSGWVYLAATAAVMAALTGCGIGGGPVAGGGEAGLEGRWVAGDFHQPTFFTDGASDFLFVMEKSAE